MTKKIFIIDTNVLIAGLLTSRVDSPTARIVDAMLDGRLMYLLSPELLQEYRVVLLRRKLAMRHQLAEDEIDRILTDITANAIWHEPAAAPEFPQGAPDPGDDHLWSLLASESTAVLVTGDQLLVQNPRPHSSVISPGTLVGWMKL